VILTAALIVALPVRGHLRAAPVRGSVPSTSNQPAMVVATTGSLDAG
jgi:hypothetical protein